MSDKVILSDVTLRRFEGIRKAAEANRPEYEAMLKKFDREREDAWRDIWETAIDIMLNAEESEAAKKIAQSVLGRISLDTDRLGIPRFVQENDGTIFYSCID